MSVKKGASEQAILAAIIDSSDDAIISKDLTSRITSWNKAAEQMFGYSAQEMVGQLIHILIPADRQQEEDIIIRKLTNGERVEHFETKRVTKLGKELDISLTISPIINENGVVVGASKIARDITRQKLAEDRVRIFNDLAQNINRKLEVDAILQLVTDASTQLCAASFGAFFYNKVDDKGEAYMLYALSGAPKEAFDKFGMPRNTAVFASTFEGTAVVRSADITKDPRYGHNSPYYGMPSGHLPVVSYLAVPVISQSGFVIGGLFFGHKKPDQFSEEHETLLVAIASQAAIALDNAKLLQEVNLLNSKKDQFIGFASHELRTPLTTLKGYLSLAENGVVKLEELLRRVKPQVERLEGIIADLLDISRIHAGKLNLNFEKVLLSRVITDSYKMLDLTKHQFFMTLPSEEIVVEVDQQKLSQVIVNLISNSIKYTAPSKAIRLSAEVIGEEAIVTVADEGVGISKDDVQKIFDQYYRVATSQHKAKGTGLGLFIAKEIVEAHAGRIWVESEPDKGSSFHIAFPVNRR